MASQVQKLQSSIAAMERLIEKLRTHSKGQKDEIQKAKAQVLGPIAGSHAHTELSAYLTQAENHATKVTAALEAAVERAKKMQRDAQGI